jgi:hypothetical protein
MTACRKGRAKQVRKALPLPVVKAAIHDAVAKLMHEDGLLGVPRVVVEHEDVLLTDRSARNRASAPKATQAAVAEGTPVQRAHVFEETMGGHIQTRLMASNDGNHRAAGHKARAQPSVRVSQHLLDRLGSDCDGLCVHALKRPHFYLSAGASGDTSVCEVSRVTGLQRQRSGWPAAGGAE